MNAINHQVFTSGISYGEALKIVGGLSSPSKMPWWGWSISALDCITGGKLREQEDTVCSGCYAMKGNYVFRNVKDAHTRRRLAYDTDPRWDNAMVVVINHLYANQRKATKENRFRWFDSGDLQSLEMLERINKIALRTPSIRHYLPTKETKIVRDFIAKHKAFAPNLFVKISAPSVGVTFKKRPHGVPFATVGRDDDTSLFQCPAKRLQGNKCLDCDHCWKNEDVNYPIH
jgi:hypothetical protein